MKTQYGVFDATVSLLSILPSSTRPAIFLRLDIPRAEGDPGYDATKPVEQITHATRLNHPQSTRIGLDEYRSAFPELIGLSDKEVIKTLITKTSAFMGRKVRISVQPQVKNGITQKSTSGEDYFNVHLLSSVNNVTDDALADKIADQLLAGHGATEALDKAFEELAGNQ